MMASPVDDSQSADQLQHLNNTIDLILQKQSNQIQQYFEMCLLPPLPV